MWPPFLRLLTEALLLRLFGILTETRVAELRSGCQKRLNITCGVTGMKVSVEALADRLWARLFEAPLAAWSGHDLVALGRAAFSSRLANCCVCFLINRNEVFVP